MTGTGVGRGRSARHPDPVELRGARQLRRRCRPASTTTAAPGSRSSSTRPAWRSRRARSGRDNGCSSTKSGQFRVGSCTFNRGIHPTIDVPSVAGDTELPQRPHWSQGRVPHLAIRRHHRRSHGRGDVGRVPLLRPGRRRHQAGCECERRRSFHRSGWSPVPAGATTSRPVPSSSMPRRLALPGPGRSRPRWERMAQIDVALVAGTEPVGGASVTLLMSGQDAPVRVRTDAAGLAQSTMPVVPGSMTVVASTSTPGPAVVYRGRPAGPDPHGAQRLVTGGAPGLCQPRRLSTSRSTRPRRSYHQRRPCHRRRPRCHRRRRPRHRRRLTTTDDDRAADDDDHDDDQPPTTVPPTTTCHRRRRPRCRPRRPRPTARFRPNSSRSVRRRSRHSDRGSGHTRRRRSASITTRAGAAAHREGLRPDRLPRHGATGRRDRDRRCRQPTTTTKGHLHSVR